MGSHEIILRYPATCAECNAHLPIGSRARYYGRNVAYGIDCHRPPWTTRSITSVSPSSYKTTDTELLETSIPLYPWQKEALRAWEDHEYTGIVEAVTGAGKTRLVESAIIDLLPHDVKVAIIVPSIILMLQWKARLEQIIGPRHIGLLGGGSHDSLKTNRVLITVINSARKHDLGLGTSTGLLVADECHRMATLENARVLMEEFTFRLGLSATYARSDGAHETHLLPYFGRVVYVCDYRRAIAEGAVAPFRVAYIGVEMPPRLRIDYENLAEQQQHARNKLCNNFGVPKEPFESFMIEIQRMRRSGTFWEQKAARDYWCAYTNKQKILSKVEYKMEVLSRLLSTIKKAKGTLLFVETIDSSEFLEIAMQVYGVKAQAIHSKTSRESRKNLLYQFKTRDIEALVAPRILDEGIDVPEADLGIILASSRSQRQMIQRMGRVLRKKNDDRQGRIAVVYFTNTSEDPTNPYCEAFLNYLQDVAEKVEYFDDRSNSEEINQFFSC